MASLSSNAGLRRAVGLMAAALAAMVVVGCGSGEDPEGERVSSVIAEVLTTDDAELKCNELVSERFIEAVYGSREDCLAAEETEADDGDVPDVVEVSEIEIAGEKATATVKEVGGETDGATGTVTMVEVDGKWRVDELGIDYLRSVLAQGFAGIEDSEAGGDAENPLSDSEVRDCVRDGLEALDDEQFRQLAYDGMADREPGQPFVEVLKDCIPEL